MSRSAIYNSRTQDQFLDIYTFFHKCSTLVVQGKMSLGLPDVKAPLTKVPWWSSLYDIRVESAVPLPGLSIFRRASERQGVERPTRRGYIY